MSGRNRRERLSPFALGLLSILGIALFVYLAFAKSIPFAKHYEVRGVFTSSNQLHVGNPVRIAGVDVGKVSKVSPGPGTTQIVTLQLSKQGQPVHADATLKIRPRVFLEGGYFVELHPGSPSARKLGRGGMIPLGQTAVPVQFHQVLGALDRPTRESLRQVLAEGAAALNGGGAEGVREMLPPLAPALKDVAWISEAARGTTPGDLPRLVGAGARVTGVLAARADALADSVTSLNRVSAAMAADDSALAASVRELDGVLAATPRALDALDGALPPLERFARTIRPALREAPPVLDRTARLLAQLDALASSPRSPSDFVRIVIRFRSVLPEIPRLALLARGLFPLVGPIVTCLDDHLAPVLQSKLQDGEHSSGRPVWQDLFHTFVGFSGGSGNFDANGPWARYIGAMGAETISTGNVPGVGQLVGGSDQPLQGVRPVWNGRNGYPPFRPDADCTRQAPVDLRAEGRDLTP
jgi:phospholipid/cholesterol/gamma-HCH transport system substrate-binding protein